MQGDFGQETSEQTALAYLQRIAPRGYLLLADPERTAPLLIAAHGAFAQIGTADLQAAAENAPHDTPRDPVLAYGAAHLVPHALADLAQGSALCGGSPSGTVLPMLDGQGRLLLCLLHEEGGLPEEVLAQAHAAALLIAGTRPARTVAPLGARELAYLRRVLAGETDPQIAEALNLTIRSIKERKRRIIAAADARTFPEALLRMQQAGLL